MEYNRDAFTVGKSYYIRGNYVDPKVLCEVTQILHDMIFCRQEIDNRVWSIKVPYSAMVKVTSESIYKSKLYKKLNGGNNENN